MEIIRSKMSIAHDSTGCAKFMSDLATNSIGASAYDDENQRIYITDSIYIEYTDTDSDGKGNELRLYDTDAWNGYAVIKNLNGAYINFQIFKYSSTCAAFSFATSNDPLTGWDNVLLMAVDTHGASTDMMTIIGTDGSMVKVADGTSANVNQPWAYKGSDSVSLSFPTTQIVPLVAPKSGYVADNLKTVLFAPVSNGQLTSLNVGGSLQMFYFSKGLAIPCGSSIKYTNLT